MLTTDLVWQIVAIAASAVVSYVAARRKPATPAAPGSPATPAPILPDMPIPDLIPGRPIVNALLKMIMGKVLSGVPLLTGESAFVKQFADLIAAHAPELRALLDALKTPAPAPAAPAK